MITKIIINLLSRLRNHYYNKIAELSDGFGYTKMETDIKRHWFVNKETGEKEFKEVEVPVLRMTVTGATFANAERLEKLKKQKNRVESWISYWREKERKKDV